MQQIDGEAKDKVESWIEKLFDGMIDGLIILKEQYKALEKVVVDVGKTLRVEPFKVNEYLKILPKPQNMADL